MRVLPCCIELGSDEQAHVISDRSAGVCYGITCPS
jgi:hypothetical protein